jgi:hypothetical protein
MAKKPSKPIGLSRLCNNAFEQFARRVIKDILQWTTCKQSEEAGVIRSRSPQDHIGERLLGIIMITRDDFAERFCIFFRPLAATLMALGVCI